MGTEGIILDEEITARQKILNETKTHWCRWLGSELTVDNLGSHLVLGDDQVIGDGGQVPPAHFLITDHGASEKEVKKFRRHT